MCVHLYFAEIFLKWYKITYFFLFLSFSMPLEADQNRLNQCISLLFGLIEFDQWEIRLEIQVIQENEVKVFIPVSFLISGSLSFDNWYDSSFLQTERAYFLQFFVLSFLISLYFIFTLVNRPFLNPDQIIIIVLWLFLCCKFYISFIHYLSTMCAHTIHTFTYIQHNHTMILSLFKRMSLDH
jgi:hypothetical protein